MSSRLFNVANRLPVTIGPEKISKSSGGLVSALDGAFGKDVELTWIGWPGAEIAPERKPEVERVLRTEHGAIPVFLNAAEIAGHYDGFSNASLWPLLHSMPSRFRYEEAWWEWYRNVNQKFADVVLSVARDEDIVWVHDYQLLLLPEMLRKARPALRIGFFLHTPFPGHDLFRTHPRRDELIAGVLGADLVGFHTFHFLSQFRSNVLRLLGYESDLLHIDHSNRRTRLGVFPIGIPAHKFEKELASHEFANKLAELRQRNAATKVVLSVERLDYTKGVPQRLDAIEMLLADLYREEKARKEKAAANDRTKAEHNSVKSETAELDSHADANSQAEKHEPAKRVGDAAPPALRPDEVKFVFISVPSRENVDQYKTLRESIESRIGRINGEHSTISSSPIRFFHGSIEFTELCALYAMADVGLITPLIDGMNLVAKEFVAAQGARGEPEAPGVLVLGEFAGAAEEMGDALIVNPFDARGVANAIRRAIDMPAGERRERMHSLRSRVMRRDAIWWARSFLAELTCQPPCATGSSAAAATPVGIEPRAEDEDEIDPDAIFLQTHLAESLANRRKIALCLDYDGTLREIEPSPGMAGPNEPLLALLDVMRARASEVDVTIISGRKQSDLQEWLGDEPFTLIGEHGASMRRAGSRQWEWLDTSLDYGWKDEVVRLLRHFESSTPGSFVEIKRSAVVWHYRQSDPEFAAFKAKQLIDELSPLINRAPIQVRPGRKIVEVSSSHVSKGAAIRALLNKKKYDLILLAGDDTTDETMFTLDAAAMHAAELLTVKVGAGDTKAKYSLSSPGDLREMLLAALR